MAKSLRVDHFPKNGKTSPNPKLGSITAHAKPGISGGPDIKTQFNKKPALATANKTGEGYKQPKFGIGPSPTGTYAKGPKVKTLDGVGGTKGISHPQSHAAFHALGAPKGGKY